jgi:diguanylate cyclase (GGDEF)-like protein/PAS domain S-box-containing protein
MIRASEERLAAVMEGSQLGYSDWNIQTSEIQRNERWAGMLGYNPNDIKNTLQQWEDLLHPDDRASALQAMQDHLSGKTPVHRDEYRLRAKDGSYRWILDQGRIIEYDLHGHPLRMTATHTDITARKQAEAELRQAKEALEATHKELEEAFAREQQLARIDMLTGINNRRYLFELAEHEFNVAFRYGSPMSVLMFDIDDFKLINDKFGHAIGDQALQHITQTVHAQLRSVDVFGRYGGDEFIVLLPQTNAVEARSLGMRIHEGIAAARMETNGESLALTISLGIAEIFHHAAQPDSVEGLFLRADQALYAAKQAGRNRTVIFDAK